MVKPISLLTPPPSMHTQKVTFIRKAAPFFDYLIWVFRGQVRIQSPPQLLLQSWDLGAALTLFDHLPRRNIMSCNILINGYVQKGDLESAQKVFNEMPERNVATWNAMVTGLTQFQFNEEGLGLFSEMHELGFLPDEFTLGSVLRGCAGLRALHAGRQVHAYVMKCRFEFNLVVGSSLAHMYMKSGSLEEGERVIKSLPIQNVVAWNTLIAGKAQNGHSEAVLDQYNIMKIAGFRPDKVTFVSVISSCSELATLGQGQQIHAEAIKAGASTVDAVISSLISMYSRCGCLEDSLKAFKESVGRDVVLWSSMISAYGFHGRGEEAIQLFKEMEQEELEANDVTFLSLLYACSHCGLKEKGIEFFNSMIENYGLKPRLEHYTCVVDLLGRSGRLDEAESMIRSMPVKADAIIWKTLLSACKIHKNANIAKRISEEVIRQDPQDSASYVLLSNIHASARRWQDVSEVRKAMRDRKVKKEPGISWLEIKNQVHQFCIGDKSHPQSKELDMYLQELTSELKLHGYVPDTGSVLHDMDNEEKEYNLAHHSEKLAIAFALMNTPEGVPVRVMKNLRVCIDCHVAIKYISLIKNREIIVRDASRFHHFKNGKCSCGDYCITVRKTKSKDCEDAIDKVLGIPIMKFSYVDLQVATEDFKEELGREGFGSVIKGVMADSTMIAVKRLDNRGQGMRA
ncbi:pentatricopeptide repeat-containing protein [Prunus yedoensis var. nudiflora]|uniref:Pentatricopeptide repeat-containing protein n=1 Tax=Prunus yedoensis var. nudiflora TaxID=2094558 RepID=A0A314UGZ6_PRUYE|nr:pentatricopeptide repeat-containing protein [Prunus yedoensis var. nudiflora]